MEGAFAVGALAAELDRLGCGAHGAEAGGHAVVQQGLVVVREVLEREGHFARAILVRIADGGRDVVGLVHLDAQVRELDGFAESAAEERAVRLEYEHARGAA
jgi:hypothetical protein